MTVRGRDKRRGERGQILAMMVISLIALCALVGVAADLGFSSDYRRPSEWTLWPYRSLSLT